MRELALALGFYPVVALDMGSSCSGDGNNVRWSERIFKDRWWKRKKGKKSGKGHGN